MMDDNGDWIYQEKLQLREEVRKLSRENKHLKSQLRSLRRKNNSKAARKKAA